MKLEARPRNLKILKSSLTLIIFDISSITGKANFRQMGRFQANWVHDLGPGQLGPLTVGPQTIGPNCPLFRGEQSGPGQLGPQTFGSQGPLKHDETQL